MSELFNFIKKAVEERFTGKVEINFKEGSFKINILRANIASQDLAHIKI